jgi:hypothetical protein
LQDTRRALQQAILQCDKREPTEADPLYYFVGAEVLKGRWASALLGSFTVSQKTGDNFMLI